MSNIFEYIFNLSGNYTAKIKGATEATGTFEAQVEGTRNALARFGAKLAVFDMASNAIKNAAAAMGELSKGGIELDSNMHDLSAVAGVTGDGLKQIEHYARESAKAFGTDASTAVTGYKLLLSQLSPELGKYPEALKAMGNSIQTTSKLMGNDGVAAAEVLTTAMNQYGVSLEDPMKASEEMARMMNVMAAAGQAGSAELPAIKEALTQCGMAAKAAGVSFEETNAAIQVLDKAGKKGSEGGVALRNVMSTLAKGRFLPKDVKEELAAAHVNVKTLTDTSLSLEERLKALKPVMNDQALLSKLFGQANANAAMALIGGTESLHDFTEAVTGTNSAEEQAAIVMDSYAERQARVKQKFEDLKISIFQATGNLTLWASTLTEALVPMSQMMPLVSGLWSGFKLIIPYLAGAYTWMSKIVALKWAAMWSQINRMVVAARIQMAFLNREIITGQFVSNGFAVNILRAAGALARFATVGLWNAIKAMGYYILSLVTGGTASVTFGMTAALSFKVFQSTAVSACRAVSVAIMNIPIIGWIAAAITAVIALIKLLWDKCYGFRVFIFTTWEAIKAVFNAIWIVIKAVAEQVWGFIQKVWSVVTDVATKIYNFYAKIFEAIRSVIERVWNWLTDTTTNVLDTITGIWNSAVEKIGIVINSIGDFFKSVFETVWGWIASFVQSVYDTIMQVVEWVKEIANRVKEAIVNAFEAIKAFFQSLGQTVWGFIQNIWNKVKSVASGIINTFKRAFTAVKNTINSLWNKVMGVVNKIVAKISSVCAPLVEAFRKAVNSIRDFFSRLFNWARDKFYSFLNWFIDLYNKIADALDWDRIAKLGKEAADKSWAADHEPAQGGGGGGSTPPASNGDGSVDDGAGAGLGGGGGGGNSISDGLGSVGGGKSGDKADRIKNINITIDKLIDKFTISTTNMTESRERIKDMVAEALVSAVNDVNYTVG